MEFLKGLFFDVDSKALREVPVDEVFFTILDARGNLNKIFALDKSWPLLSLKNQYLRYPCNASAVTSSRTPSTSSPAEQLTLWRRAAQSYHDELQNLVVATSYDRFWCHVLHDPKGVLNFLRSFTTKALRSYDLPMTRMSEEDAALHSRISTLVFLAFLTLACDRRANTEHISEKKHAEILQKFMKLPLLMDICSLYGGNRHIQTVLGLAVTACFHRHRRLFTEFRIALRDISESLFHPLEERLSERDPDMPEQPVSRFNGRDLVDVVGYVCDILSTLQRITAVASEDILAVLREAKLSQRLVQFAEKVVWSLNHEVSERLQDADSVEGDLAVHLQRAAKQGAIAEWALVDTFRRLICPAFYVGEPTGSGVATSLSILLETLPHHQLFTIIYEKWAPIKNDIDLGRRLKANVEESVVDFLAHAVKEAFQSRKMDWDFATSGNFKAATKLKNSVEETSASAVNTKISSASGDVQVDKITHQILEMLDGMGLDKAYVKACVCHYKCDLNATVDAILSGSVPIEITNSTTPEASAPSVTTSPVTLSKRDPPPYNPSPSVNNQQTSRYPEKAVAHTAPGTVIEKVYYGKRDLYEETEEESISDATRLVTIARVQQMYEDEYDDTYDEFEAEGGQVRLNDKEDTVAIELKAMVEEDKAQPASVHHPHRTLNNSSDNHKSGAHPPVPTSRSSTGNQRFPSRGGPSQSQPAQSRQHLRAPHPSQTQSHQQESSQRGGQSQPPPPVAPSRDPTGRVIRDAPAPNTNRVQREVQRPEERAEEDDVEAPVRSSDPWARQMEDNMAAQMARRGQPGQSAARTGGGAATGGDARTRANKEKNKAHAGNHNRKDRGEWKRREF
ncbi:hypothetical protein BV898_03489 [Hypsibius exemplaris]|uniref:Activating signal cointegrator 1 complex subunit 2 n=1 Tax=Hypsibius exemplaris TaxID=2072580 RepID=A0A1W0X5L0_HYPEX|nr:hypothetical protein BV898_03489 [Hypsibius exemplaris]